jgi:hypothetical protein
MEPGLTAFERELLSRRERYNTLYALARRARPRLDAEQLKHNLQTLVAPILQSLPSEQAGPLVEPLYDLCLELTGQDLFARSPAVQEVWRRLLPQAAVELCQEPHLLVAALTNAAYNLEREETTRLDSWFAIMESSRVFCQEPRRWLEVAQIGAWRCGMAHLRESAIALGNRLPEELRQQLFPDWERETLDPWHGLRKSYPAPAIIRRVGAFLGFGGRFRQPPWVAYAGVGRFLVEDGSESWLLSVDAFGATLKAATAEIFDSARADVSVDARGDLCWGGQRARFDELAPVRSWAASEHILAVTSDHSHQVFLVLGPEA